MLTREIRTAKKKLENRIITACIRCILHIQRRPTTGRSHIECEWETNNKNESENNEKREENLNCIVVCDASECNKNFAWKREWVVDSHDSIANETMKEKSIFGFCLILETMKQDDEMFSTNEKTFLSNFKRFACTRRIWKLRLARDTEHSTACQLSIRFQPRKTTIRKSNWNAVWRDCIGDQMHWSAWTATSSVDVVVCFLSFRFCLFVCIWSAFRLRLIQNANNHANGRHQNSLWNYNKVAINEQKMNNVVGNDVTNQIFMFDIFLFQTPRSSHLFLIKIFRFELNVRMGNLNGKRSSSSRRKRSKKKLYLSFWNWKRVEIGCAPDPSQ